MLIKMSCSNSAVQRQGGEEDDKWTAVSQDSCGINSGPTSVRHDGTVASTGGKKIKKSRRYFEMVYAFP